MKLHSTSVLSLLAAAGVACVAMAAPPIANPDVMREGAAGESRRDGLTARELKTASIDWSLLSDWQNGTAPTAESLKDKVVLVTFWSGWQPSNLSLLERIGRLAEREKDKGLVVIAAHNDARFDKAAEVLSARGAKVLLAKDGGNKLRAALSSDGDPDLYLIDRAGNLRFADLSSDSLDKAVSMLVKETPAEATAAPGAFAAMLKEQEAAKGRTTRKGDGIDAGKKLKVPFPAPTPDQYDRAFWPTKNDKEAVSSQGTDYQSQTVPFNFEAVQWLNTPEGKSPDLMGKVVVVDFWATWCGPCIAAMPLMDEMQRTFRDDLQIVGVSGFKFGNNAGNSEEAEKFPQGETRPTVQQFLREKNSEYAHAYDLGSAIGKKVQFNAIPLVMVLSSDGVVRWQGNPHSNNFRNIVAQVIKVDPGVQARRAAEQKAVMSKGG